MRKVIFNYECQKIEYHSNFWLLIQVPLVTLSPFPRFAEKRYLLIPPCPPLTWEWGDANLGMARNERTWNPYLHQTEKTLEDIHPGS